MKASIASFLLLSFAGALIPGSAYALEIKSPQTFHLQVPHTPQLKGRVVQRGGGKMIDSATTAVNSQNNSNGSLPVQEGNTGRLQEYWSEFALTPAQIHGVAGQ